MTPIRTAKRQPGGGSARLRAVPAVYKLNIAFVVLGAALVRLLASRPMALAVLGTLPVSLLRTWLFRSGIERGLPAARMVGRAMVRMVLSVGALIVGALFGAEVLLGVLIGLCMELAAYAIAGQRLGRHGRAR